MSHDRRIAFFLPAFAACALLTTAAGAEEPKARSWEPPPSIGWELVAQRDASPPVFSGRLATTDAIVASLLPALGAETLVVQPCFWPFSFEVRVRFELP